MRIGTKWCGGCQQDVTGDLDALFYKNRRNPDKLGTFCKLCAQEYNRNYYRQHKAQIGARVARWRVENPEKLKAMQHRHDRLRTFRRRLARCRLPTEDDD